MTVWGNKRKNTTLEKITKCRRLCNQVLMHTRKVLPHQLWRWWQPVSVIHYCHFMSCRIKQWHRRQQGWVYRVAYPRAWYFRRNGIATPYAPHRPAAQQEMHIVISRAWVGEVINMWYLCTERAAKCYHFITSLRHTTSDEMSHRPESALNGI